MTKNEIKNKYFTKYDLNQRNTINYAWVSLFGKIYNLTEVIKNHRNTKQGDNTLKHIGKDVSHFFDSKSRLPKSQNEYLKTLKSEKETIKNQLINFSSINRKEIPWFKNVALIIGKITKREIKVRIVNTLSYTEDILIVPIEENLNEICERYLKMNSHAKSYVWKDIEGRVLNMEFNLYHNNLGEDLELNEYINLPEEDIYIPTLFLHFNDDLTIM